MKPEGDNPATAVFERGMRYRWVVVVAAVIAGGLAGGAKLSLTMLVFLLLVGGVFVLATTGGERLFQRAFGARLERRLSGAAHPQRVMTGLVAVAVIAVGTLISTIAGGPAWVRMAAYALVAIILGASLWSAGRSSED